MIYRLCWRACSFLPGPSDRNEEGNRTPSPTSVERKTRQKTLPSLIPCTWSVKIHLFFKWCRIRFHVRSHKQALVKWACLIPINNDNMWISRSIIISLGILFLFRKHNTWGHLSFLFRSFCAKSAFSSNQTKPILTWHTTLYLKPLRHNSTTHDFPHLSKTLHLQSYTVFLKNIEIIPD